MSQIKINVYDQILNLFVSKDDLRDWMLTPAFTGNLVFATDGSAAVFLDKSQCSLDYPLYKEKEDIHQYLLPESNQNLKIPVSDLVDFFGKVPLVAEEITTTSTERCSACDGYGEVDFEFFHNGETYETEAECPVCDGSGKETIKTKKLTGAKVGDPKSIIKIGSSTFLFPVILKAYQTAQLLSVDYITLIQQNGPGSASIFMIGGAKLLLMPYLTSVVDTILHEIQIPEVQAKTND